MKQKQILAVIGGVTFTSLPIGEKEAQHVLDSFSRAAPNCDPQIVDAQPVTTPIRNEDVAAAVKAGLKSYDRELLARGNNLDVLPANLLKNLVDYYVEMGAARDETAARALLRTASFDGLLRAFCAWNGYGVNPGSLASAVRQLYKAVHGDSDS
jgi:hypothetical protein